MINEKEKLSSLKLVRDIPEFELEYNKDKDKFNHKTYAATISQIIENNVAPLAIGLLGPWGTGKSTILNMLLRNLGKKKNYKFVYFNAWKYSDDSFRRQFILECINSLIADKISRDKMIHEFKYRFIAELRREVTSLRNLLKIKIKVDIPTLISIILALAFMSPFFILGISKGDVPLWISSIIMGVILFILQKMVPQLLQINLPVDIDPKLVLPEQFEDEFKKLLKKVDSEKTIFVIDDIDRCPSHMIMDILDSVKNFLAPSRLTKHSHVYDKCYFIVAMDDEAVIKILKKTRGEKYGNEEILKFFDATVRLSPVRIGDLIEFSKVVAKEINLPIDVVNVAIYGGFDTPRKIKHFLNTFRVTYHNAIIRHLDGSFPFVPSDISSAIAKILVIKIGFRNRFNELLHNPAIIKEWERNADALLQKPAEERNITFIDEQFFKFIWATKDIQLHNIDALLHFKLPTYAANLPEYSYFKTVVLQGDIGELQKLLKNVKSNEQKEALVETIREMLDFEPQGLFLTKILDAGFMIYQAVDFSTKMKSMFAGLLLRHVIKHRKILSFDPDLIFNMATYLRNKEQWEQEIIKLGVDDINKESTVPNVSKFIDILYEKGYIG